MAGWGADSNSVAVSRADARRERAEVDTKVSVVDSEGESVKSLVDILEAGFDQVAIAGKKTGGVLTDGVCKGVGGGGFFAGGEIEIAHLDDIIVGGESGSEDSDKRWVISDEIGNTSKGKNKRFRECHRGGWMKYLGGPGGEWRRR